MNEWKMQAPCAELGPDDNAKQVPGEIYTYTHYGVYHDSLNSYVYNSSFVRKNKMNDQNKGSTCNFWACYANVMYSDQCRVEKGHCKSTLKNYETK